MSDAFQTGAILVIALAQLLTVLAQLGTYAALVKHSRAQDDRAETLPGDG